MLVTLTNTDAITVELPVDSLTWALTSTRRDGEATVFVPRGNAALAAAYLEQDGGSLIEIRHPSLGLWRGVIVGLRWGREGVQLRALHFTAITKIVPVALSANFTALTAGAIAYAAVQSAVTGLGRAVLRAGTFVEAAPVIPEYTFSGQSLANVLDDLAERSGQEWAVSDSGAISWLPKQGSLYDRWLCDSGDLADGERLPDVTERTVAIKARDAQGREQTITMPDRATAGFWPRVDVVSIGSTSAAVTGNQALQQLSARRGSTVRFQFRIRQRPGG